MFLALNELLKEKARFALISFVIVLVSYLVFFLLALAYGLASSYTEAVYKWDAKEIILSENANNTIGRSIITKSDYNQILPQKDTATDTAAPLGVAGATITKNEAKDVFIFGVDPTSFIAPTLAEGDQIEQPGQVVIDSQLIKIGLDIGDSFQLRGGESIYTIVGTTESASFQTSPVIYMLLDDWRQAASETSGMTSMRDDTSISAIISKGDLALGSQLSKQTIKQFIDTLPGYRAQILTFSLMIGFLIAIAAFVLAIFIYILTLQKKEIFGVLKAEGVPSSYIGGSVIIQVGILSVSGLVVGMALALLTGALLAAKVPFAINPVFFVSISGLFIGCAIIGALASVRSVTKIDPVEAIG